MLLSPSRFEEELREVGFLDADVSSVLNVHVRNPGGDVLDGHVPDRPPKARLLTRMAKSATAGKHGEDVDGYRNYRGAHVVGAWRWLDRHRLGVALEIEVDEAYSSMRHLRRMFWVPLRAARDRGDRRDDDVVRRGASATTVGTRAAARPVSARDADRNGWDGTRLHRAARAPATPDGSEGAPPGRRRRAKRWPVSSAKCSLRASSPIRTRS